MNVANTYLDDEIFYAHGTICELQRSQLKKKNYIYYIFLYILDIFICIRYIYIYNT